MIFTGHISAMPRFAALFAVCGALLLGGAPASPSDAFLPSGSVSAREFGEDWTSRSYKRFTLWHRTASPIDFAALADRIHAGHAIAANAIPTPIYFSYDVVAVSDMDEFEAMTGLPQRTTLAAAQDHPPTMILNFSRFNSLQLREQDRTAAHEVIHLYLGATAPARLPRWLEEGIAMHAAGQPGPAPGSLAVRRRTGGLFPLDRIAGGFPSTVHGRSLAYDQSHSVVGFMIREHFAGAGVRGLLQWLLDDELGADRIGRFQESDYARALESRWLSEFSVHVAALSIIADPNYVWSMGGLLLCLSWVLVRRRRRLQAARLGWLDDSPDAVREPPRAGTSVFPPQRDGCEIVEPKS